MSDTKSLMSVAVVSDSIYPFYRGGKETHYHQVLSRLRADLQITLYTMHWWSERKRTKQIEGVTCRAICPMFPLYRASRRSMLEAFAFAFACLRLLGKHFDVVEADNVPHPQLFTLRLVTKLKRRPLVVTWYEVWGRQYWVNYLGRFRGTVAWWIERSAMGLPDQILAVSAGTADRLRIYVGDRVPIRIIQPGIDLDLISSVDPAGPEEAAELIYVGRLLKHKGVHLLIDSLAKLPTERPLRLLVVGDGPERDELEKQVARAGLVDRVRFRSDVIDTKEVFALIKAAQVFVFPSIREGFGIAPLEALACGTPVVTTSHPDNNARHLIAGSDRGYLAEPTVEALVAAIEQALANTTRSREPVEAWLKEFDWSTVAEDYLDALTIAVQAGSGTLSHP